MINRSNGWVLVLLILSGIVIGGFIGEFLGATFPKSEIIRWLNYSKTFGFDTISLHLGSTLIFNLGLKITISISSILGVVLAIVIYRKL